VSSPKNGITVLAHVQQSLTEATSDLTLVTAAVHHGRRLRPTERDSMRRTLAGVISACETVRIWLDGGAPLTDARRVYRQTKDESAAQE
jgi:hypothetical protein